MENNYIQSFINYAHQIKSRGIPYNRKMDTHKNFLNLCEKTAFEYLGKSYSKVVNKLEVINELKRLSLISSDEANKLSELSDVDFSIQLSLISNEKVSAEVDKVVTEYANMFSRKWIRETYESVHSLLINDMGDIVIDHIHLLALYDVIMNTREFRNKSDEDLRTLIGLMYKYAGKEIYRERVKLSKVTTDDIIVPSYTLTPTNFGWNKCKYITRKYMLSETPIGMKSYYFETPNLALIASVMHFMKLDYEKAKDFVDKADGGLFISGLKKETENQLIPYILSKEFGHLDGLFASAYIKENNKLESSFEHETYNVYTMSIKPLMIELLGFVIFEFKKEVAKNTELDSQDLCFTHLSPYRFGFCINKSINIEDAFPTFKTGLKTLIEPVAKNLVFGLYL